MSNSEEHTKLIEQLDGITAPRVDPFGIRNGKYRTDFLVELGVGSSAIAFLEVVSEAKLSYQRLAVHQDSS